MARVIEPKIADLCKWHTGPYIFFYNGQCDGYNYYLVSKMNEMARKYQMIKVHQIDWSKRKCINPMTPNVEMNTVFIYFRKRLEDAVLCPNKDKIDNIFKKAVNFYNINIKDKASKVGTKSPRYNNSNPGMANNNISKRRMCLNECQKRYILKQQIEYIDDQHVTVSTVPEISNFQKKKNNIYETPLDKITNIGSKIDKFEIPVVVSSNKWYSDVTNTELPFDIFQTTSTSDLSQNIKIPRDFNEKSNQSSLLSIFENTQKEPDDYLGPIF